MTSDIDIYRSAKLLIDQHGEDAGLETAMRAHAMLEKGDMEGETTCGASPRQWKNCSGRSGVGSRYA